MTSPEERLIRAETRQDATDSDLYDIKSDIRVLREDVTELLRIANTGKGALSLLWKIGAALGVLAGVCAAVWPLKGH